MATSTRPILRHARRWLIRSRPADSSDAELIRRFTDNRDEQAFAELVDRHGPMVLAVAGRAVGDYQTAEDVFQATFLALARRADRLRRPEALPGWLHTTAHHLGLHASRARARRQRAESNTPAPRPTGPPDLDARELLAILDVELAGLPDRLRLPLVLCCLEGLTQDEAAARLGWSPGSIKGRLERGRRRLRDRLARRGLTFPVGAGAALLVTAANVVAGPLRDAAIRAATGQSVTPSVVALASRVTGAGTRVSTWGAFAVAGLLAIGTVALLGWQGADPPPPKSAPAKRSAELPADRLPEGAIARLGWSPHAIGSSSFALTADENEIVTVSPEGIVRRFDARTGELCKRKLLTPRNDTWSAARFVAHLSADGATAALHDYFSGESRVSVWDVSKEKVLLEIQPEKERQVAGFSLSPDGKVVAITEHAQGTAALRMIDVATGKGKQLGAVERNVYDPRFSADGKRLVVQHVSGREEPGRYLSCFDLPTGKQVWKLPANCDKFAVSSDGRLVMFAQYDRPSYRIIETDLTTGQTTETELPRVDGIGHPNVQIAFHPDGRTLIISEFNELISFDIRASKIVGRIKWTTSGTVGLGPEVGAFSADGKTVVTKRGVLQRWDLTTGKAVFESVNGEVLGSVTQQVAFTPDGKEVFASGGSKSARWNLASGKRVASHQEPIGNQLVTTPGGLRSVRANDYHNPHEIVVYDPVAGRALKTVQWAADKTVGVDSLNGHSLATDGRTLFLFQLDAQFGAKNAQVIAYDIVTDRQLSRFNLRGTEHYSSASFSPCGRWFGFEGKVYHTRTGTELFAPVSIDREGQTTGTLRAFGSMWFSPDGRLLAAPIYGIEADKAAIAFGVWELASGRLITRITDRSVAQMAFSSDGRTIALVDGLGAHVHDLLTGRRIAEFATPDIMGGMISHGIAAKSIAFSPDGRQLATGHRDGYVTLWKVPQPPPHGAGDDWSGLKETSPVAARAAVDRVVRDPAAFKALVEKFRPPAEVPNPQLASLIADLDSSTFATREAASKKLRGLGATAEPALRKAQAAAPSPEARKRLDDLLAAIPAVQALPVSGETLRGVRVVEILERIGTAEARELLQAWTDQGKDPRVAAEARAALGRLGSPIQPMGK